MAAAVGDAMASLPSAGSLADLARGAPAPAEFPPQLLREYLELLLPVVMAATPDSLARSMFANTAAAGDWRSTARAFASEPGRKTIYVEKLRRQGESDADGGNELDSFFYRLAWDPSYTPNHISAIALVKRIDVLDPEVPLTQQLNLMSLFGPASVSDGPDGRDAADGREAEEANGKAVAAVHESPYEALYSVMHNVMVPWFDAYVTSKASDKQVAGSNRTDADNKAIPMAKRRFNDLESSLKQLQQSVDVRTVELYVNPLVRAEVEQAEAEGRQPRSDSLRKDENASSIDDALLNKLSSEVNGWAKEVLSVTSRDHDVEAGSAWQEINFWLAMDRALEHIEAQIARPDVQFTLRILSNEKRWHAVAAFQATGVAEKRKMVSNHVLLMRDFPLDELLSATDLDMCSEALESIFTHLIKKLRISPYPVKRALPFVAAISRDLNETMRKILDSHRLMFQDFARFTDTVKAAQTVFSRWDDLMKEFVNVAREVTRKRLEKFIPIKVTAHHKALAERLVYIFNFRSSHDQLRSMVSSGRSLAAPAARAGQVAEGALQKSSGQDVAGIEMAEEIEAAYEAIKTTDVLDVTPEGTVAWSQAEAAYNERVARVENSLIARLRDLLGQAKSAREMLRVLSQFNSLFVRPKVRGAVQEYQQQLLDSVKRDIESLHDKFKSQYRASGANHMSQLRDVPEIAGAIIWARQIERQLDVFMRRVQDALGDGWDSYSEGKKLSNERDTFRRKLDTRPLFDAWLQDILKREPSIRGRLFDVTRIRATDSFQLSVNFDPQVIALFKEVRNLTWLGFPIPHSISNFAKDAKRVYPHAVSLMETVRTYTQTCAQVRANPTVACLIAQVQNDVHAQISQGMALRWENFGTAYDSHRTAAHLPGAVEGLARENKQVLFVRQLASSVSLFQDTTDELIVMQREVNAAVDELSSCPYTLEAFSALLSKIQRTIDRLNLEGYPNLDHWVAELDLRIEALLLERLRSISVAWCAAFVREDDSEGHARDSTANTRKGSRNAPQAKAVLERDHVGLTPVTHELRIRNQVIYLDPPIEDARANFYKQLHDVLAIVCGLKRVQSARYEIGMQMRKTDGSASEQSYVSLLTRFTDDTLSRPFALIERKVAEVAQYVAKWLQFQALWDLESEHVYARLGDSLEDWQRLLSEIRRTRSTFDNSDTQRSFGIAVIDYEQVQSKVNAKYDTWQRDLLNRFGTKLGAAMRETHAAIRQARVELEQHSIEASSTAQTVAFITSVQDLKRRVKRWTPQIAVFGQGQKTLERQRYLFTQDWLYVDQVEGEWSAFNEILARKNASIQEQLAGLQMKIIAEDRIVADKIELIVGEWEAQKPIQGTMRADAAMNTIGVFEARVTKLSEDRDLVVRAKEALDLEHTADDRLEPVAEEVRDLKAVWTALSGTWSQLAELREGNWSNVQPRKLRQQLDAILNQTKEMPSRMRQYAAFEYVQDHLRTLLKANPLVADLKSEAMRERHWRSLFKQLNIKSHYTPSSMTLGTVWDLDLKRHDATVKAVITIAQGELALEEYLKQVREIWTSYDLELVNYQGKCRLIRGWDPLFTQAGDHTSALRSMSNSPYFKVFEEEANLWTGRLEVISLLFETARDVQTKWVDCSGIFSGAGIRQILPMESQRFQTIDTEFQATMKKIVKSPFVLDVIQLPGIQASFERLRDLLEKMQKALAAFLEKQRNIFPRFYFLGDSDLLSLLGSSNDIARVTSHLKKMFQGVASATIDEADQTRVLGVVSPQGEAVLLGAPVETKGAAVHEWLQALESELRRTTALRLAAAHAELHEIREAGTIAQRASDWIGAHPGQALVLALQLEWTSMVEAALDAGSLADLPFPQAFLDELSALVVQDLSPLKRKSIENLMSELVHQRNIIAEVVEARSTSSDDFAWKSQMRFYSAPGSETAVAVSVAMADATFDYGFEYLGVPESLVCTSLTTRCFLTQTQALSKGFGGGAVGPAGTGKTETIRFLATRLGLPCFVTCCDDSFDVKAVARALIGSFKTGAWSCFDEMNRLTETTLSSVSQDLLAIQTAKRAGKSAMISGQEVVVAPSAAAFITLNPGYSGRVVLPASLVRQFRNIVMSSPGLTQIAEVMLFAQGFKTSGQLASKIVPLFSLCAEQLSKQPHYDFGLRALKQVLVSAGRLVREQLAKSREADADVKANIAEQEQEILVQSVIVSVAPKLVGDDVTLLTNLLGDVFPGVMPAAHDFGALRTHIEAVCAERNLVADELWVSKCLQVYQVSTISHGLMLVGPSGMGKTQAWQVLLAALQRHEGVEAVSYVIDPKAVSKDALYGTLDPTTREWTDGLFTNVLRRILDNVRGESAKRHWIVFDGDVDPEWVENLNSVLDDNKLLTLPNGERLDLPPNVRIVFEVEHLRYATLATVSRCGMIWFSDDSVKPAMLFANYLGLLRSTELDSDDDDSLAARRLVGAAPSALNEVSPKLLTQRVIADAIAPFFERGALVELALEYAAGVFHIMDFIVARALSTLFSLVNKTARNVADYNAQHPDFPLSVQQVQSYATKRLIVGLVWAFTGDSKLDVRAQMGEFLRDNTGLELPPLGNSASLIDYDVQVSTGEWYEWSSRVPTVEIETHAVASADVVIPTMDTVRHEEVLYSWLSEHKPLMLCGPPGSGKTMTLFSALRKLPDQEVVGLNFSSATTPELILNTFEQYCEYRKTPNGVVLSPQQMGRWIVLFCDEINLPARDNYGTQRVISFLRQLVECGGFWRASDLAWVTLERIQFVGACNPPTDPGRVPLSHRFLRHAPLVMVDYPGEVSLNQIYGTFNRALLKLTPNLRGYAEALTSAMVDFFLASQRRFTPDIQAHYVYSPRELSRWVRGLYEHLKPIDDTVTLEGLVRVWAHEGLRLFRDRLVGEDEKEWTDQQLDQTALTRFPTVEHNALQRPIIFSNWLTRNTSSVGLDELRAHTVARMAQYSEEELDTKLVLHDSVLGLATSVDRVLRQRQGHLLLIGASGSGRTTVTRFVAWLVGLSVFTIAPSRKYGMAEFDEDLRTVLRRAGTQGEKICFIIDEAQIKSPAFLERMNTLLANSEVPGLFENDEYSALMTACKEGSQRDGLMLDSPEELYNWFSSEIGKNLHVVFTMNVPESGVGSKAAASPALFNRCVLLFL